MAPFFIDVGCRVSLLLCLAVLFFLTGGLAAQELQPRAYLPTPVGVNFFGTSYSNNRGGLLFDPSLPLDDAHVNAHIVTFAFGQTLGVAGRTAQVLAIVPYVKADMNALLMGDRTYITRSGLGDVTFRYGMNILGAPSMNLKEFREYRQKTIVGASVTVTAPTGQYDPVRLINIGSNRWALKPEIGVSHALGKWSVEGAAGVWFYTSNTQFNVTSTRKQTPLGSLQIHLVRALPRRTWLAVDGTLYMGGRSQVNGRDNADYLSNSRLGVSMGYILSPRQSIKVSYFKGSTTRVGTDISSIGVSYNVIWMKGR